jgi:uncharacterized protein
MSLPDTLEALLSPRAYPHSVQAVQLVETHISWILLTGEVAYKIKRPVALAFVDLRSPEHREFLCNEEVRLNRRFAPDLYLGVCRITADEQGATVDGLGRVIEHAVRMRQFERRDELDTLLESNRIGTDDLGEFGRELARIHSTLPSAASDSQWGRAEAVHAALLRNLDETTQAARGFADTAQLYAMRRSLEQTLEAASHWMAGRHARGNVRECHGDLHCSNVVRVQSRLLAFDCLEFEPAFRWIDVADEIAFLLADLESYDRPTHAQAFLNGYLEQSGDYDACRFLHLYKAHRSFVRAKVTVLSVAGSGDRDSKALDRAQKRYNAHIRCAHDSLSPKRPLLVLMSGLSGSGKTWLATRLALPLGAVHIRSDVERKRLAGLTASERSGSGVAEGLYSSDMSARLHRYLLEAAESTLAGGCTTIVDATFNQRADRGQFAALANQLGVRICLIHCDAPVDVLRSRIAERARRGGDASEADLAVLEWQQRHYQPLLADESLDVFEASTGDPAVLGKVERYITSVRATPPSMMRESYPQLSPRS